MHVTTIKRLRLHTRDRLQHSTRPSNTDTTRHLAGMLDDLLG